MATEMMTDSQLRLVFEAGLDDEGKAIAKQVNKGTDLLISSNMKAYIRIKTQMNIGSSVPVLLKR